MSAQVIELNIRPAKIVLDWVHNPAGNGDWFLNSARDLEQSAGTVPDFFAEGIQGAETLEDVAERMDDLYQFGGFKYAYQGFVDDEALLYLDNWYLCREELTGSHTNASETFWLQAPSEKDAKDECSTCNAQVIRQATKAEALEQGRESAMFPLLRLKGGDRNRFTCYVYEIGMTAILDDKLPGESMIARFD